MASCSPTASTLPTKSLRIKITKDQRLIMPALTTHHLQNAPVTVPSPVTELPLALSVPRTAVVKHPTQLLQVRHSPQPQLRSLDVGPTERRRRLLGETEIPCLGAGAALLANLARMITARIKVWMKGWGEEILGYFEEAVQHGQVAQLVQVGLRAVAL